MYRLRWLGHVRITMFDACHSVTDEGKSKEKQQISGY